MRAFTKILSFLMLLVLLTAEDCGNNSVATRKEDGLSEMFRNIEDDFGNDELSEVVMSAFEKRAIQKLKDISDYINICADTSLSVQFREQAKQMMQRNFTVEDEVRNFYKSLNLVEDTVNTALFYLKSGKTLKTVINSVEIRNHFQKESDSKYIGDIRFTQEMYLTNPMDTTCIATFQCRINMLAIKSTKNFGNKTEKVWEVYLGESNLLNQLAK